jgi:ABC-type sulfate transport system substrate-binding protein
LSWLFGRDDERVIPASTLLVENPAAVIDRHADAHGVRPAAQALLDYLWTREAQELIAGCGLRPVDPAVAEAKKDGFPEPADLWTIEFLGGWERAARDILVLANDAVPQPRPGR